MGIKDCVSVCLYASLSISVYGTILHCFYSAQCVVCARVSVCVIIRNGNKLNVKQELNILSRDESKYVNFTCYKRTRSHNHMYAIEMYCLQQGVK